MLIIALVPIIIQQTVVAQAVPSVFVDPLENFFYTDTTSVGTEFSITIEAADWPEPGVYSFELKLYYDPTMLEPVPAKIGVDPDFWITAFVAASGLDEGAPFVDGEGNPFLWFSATLLGAGGKVGGGILAKAGFKIIAEPAAGKTLSCDLDLRDVIMVDPSTSPPTGYPADYYEVQSGIYQYISPPPPKPLLKASSHAWDEGAAEAAGRLFDIEISVIDLEADWRVVGIQFWLEFNGTLLSTSEEQISEGDFFAYFGGSDPPTFFNAFVEDDNVIAFDLQLPPWPGPEGWATGSGVVAIIQFEAIYSAPPAADCDLTLFNVLFVDADGLPVDYNLEHGRYVITVAPPPWLSVTPKEQTLEEIGESFDLNVAINELDAGFRMVGAELRIHYDTSVLETSEEWITEGTDNIMREVADRIGEGLFFQAYVQEDYGLIGIIILPLPNGTWPYFPEGTGLLATIKFEAITQLETEDLETEVRIGDVLLADADAKVITVDAAKTEQEGTCTVTIKQAFVAPPPDRIVDVFTQYDEPYGGQGADVPSDAFAPQGQVELYSEVTYRGDGVPGKPVTYRIKGPNEYEFIGTEFSDSQGTALLEFSIPASDLYFGIWEVTASADIAGEIATDHLIFRVGWLIEVRSITLTPFDGELPIEGEILQQLYKGRKYTTSVSLKIITMQHPTKCVQLKGVTPKVLLAYSGFDELKQPIFYRFVDITGGIGPKWFATPTVEEMKAFVLDPEGRSYNNVDVSIIVPDSAFSGIGSIYANILTDYPALNGVPYSDPTIGMKSVWISRFVTPVPPPPPPTVETYLEVSSKIWDNAAADAVDGVFTIEITIHNVDPDSHIVAIEFEVDIQYPLSPDDVLYVVEGYFISQFGPVYFIYHVEDGVLVGELQLPPWPGEEGWMRGSGTVAVIQLKTNYRAPPEASCELTLLRAMMVDADGNSIDFERLEHGYYEITP